MNKFSLTESQVKNILLEIPHSKDDILFVSGSLIQGVGNDSSDLDVFVFTNDLKNNKIEDFCFYKLDNMSTGGKKVDGLQIDVEYWDINFVANLFKNLSMIDFQDLNVRTMNNLKYGLLGPQEILSFYHRFCISQPIFNSKEFNKFKEMFDENKYFNLKIRFLVNFIDNRYEDLIGNLSDSSYKNGIILAREVYLDSLGVLLLINNISYDRNKWILKLIYRNEHIKSIQNEFESIERIFFSDIGEDGGEVMLNYIIKCINKIVEGVEL